MKLIGYGEAAAIARDAAASERPVSRALRAHFSKAWHVTTPGDNRQFRFALIPDGCAELAWADGKLCVLGPRSVAKSETELPGRTAVALRFKAGAAPSWLGVSAHDLVDNRLMLEDVDERGAYDLYEAIRDATDPETITLRMQMALSKIAAQRDAPSPCLDAVMELLHRGRLAKGRLVRALQNLTNLSERSVRRETERFFGFGPKTLERIVRLQHFLRRAMNAQDNGLAALAVSAGYSDQSHLTRETRDLTGLTPKMLRSWCSEHVDGEAMEGDC